MLQFADLCALTFGGMCSWRRVAVAWVFAIVLDVEIFLVHEIIEKCKNHDTRWERPGVQPGPAWPAITELYFYRFLGAGRKAIAYTDLLGIVAACSLFADH